VNRAAAFVVAVLAAGGQAAAVTPGAVSVTAAAVCDYRAIGARHPDPKLRNQDRLAARLCTPIVLPHDYALARAAIEREPEKLSGYFFVNARTLHIDAVLRRAAASGIRQVVVLGAGYDSRAYRFRKVYPKLEFFEVDLPPMIESKKRAIQGLLGALPGHVHYVPIDFNVQTLDSVLAAAGYDAGRKTLFILEGLVMYVNAAGNSATFDFIGKNAASGSLVIYDYVLRQVIEGDFSGTYGAATVVRDVAAIGEPFVSGWTPDEAAEFASRHGLKVLEDLDDAALTRRYLMNSRGKPDGRLPNWQRIIDASVP
jgi:methyltransferase (TIGR00027 family)